MEAAPAARPRRPERAASCKCDKCGSETAPSLLIPVASSNRRVCSACYANFTNGVDVDALPLACDETSADGWEGRPRPLSALVEGAMPLTHMQWGDSVQGNDYRIPGGVHDVRKALSACGWSKPLRSTMYRGVEASWWFRSEEAACAGGRHKAHNLVGDLEAPSVGVTFFLRPSTDGTTADGLALAQAVACVQWLCCHRRRRSLCVFPSM